MNKTDTLSQHTQSDLSCNDNMDLISVLESNWITDEVIQLNYGILSLTIVSDNDNIFLLDPIIAHTLKSADFQQVDDIMLPLNLQDKSHIFIPLMSKEGGSHWSLLYFSKERKTFSILRFHKSI